MHNQDWGNVKSTKQDSPQPDRFKVPWKIGETRLPPYKRGDQCSRNWREQTRLIELIWFYVSGWGAVRGLIRKLKEQSAWKVSRNTSFSVGAMNTGTVSAKKLIQFQMLDEYQNKFDQLWIRGGPHEPHSVLKGKTYCPKENNTHVAIIFFKCCVKNCICLSTFFIPLPLVETLPAASSEHSPKWSPHFYQTPHPAFTGGTFEDD